MKSRARDTLFVIGAALVFIAVAITVLLMLTPGDPAAGPAPIPWDRAVCSECGMHVGEPRFAAQLRDPNGDLHAFDDPGCLFTWRQHAGAVSGVYFHSSTADAWLADGEVGFIEQQPTPMGYGLVAVPAGTANAMSAAAAVDFLSAHHRLGAGGGVDVPMPNTKEGGSH